MAQGAYISNSTLWNPNEQYDLDENGQYKPVKPQLQQAGAPDHQAFLSGLEQQYGIQAGSTDLANLQGKNPEDVEGYKQALTAQFAQRASSNGGGGGPQGPQYQTPTQQWNAQPAQAQSSDALYKLLMERAQQSTTVDRNSPNVRSQVDPVVAQQTRASRSYLDDLAEKSGPLANLQGERRLAAERSGQAAGALESEVIGREQNALLQEKMQALQLGAQFMSAQERNQLEREIAYLMDASRNADRDLSRQGMLQGNDQFLRELALREWQAGDDSDYRWAGLGG